MSVLRLTFGSTSGTSQALAQRQEFLNKVYHQCDNEIVTGNDLLQAVNKASRKRWKNPLIALNPMKWATTLYYSKKEGAYSQWAHMGGIIKRLPLKFQSEERTDEQKSDLRRSCRKGLEELSSVGLLKHGKADEFPHFVDVWRMVRLGFIETEGLKSKPPVIQFTTIPQTPEALKAMNEVLDTIFYQEGSKLITGRSILETMGKTCLKPPKKTEGTLEEKDFQNKARHPATVLKACPLPIAYDNLSPKECAEIQAAFQKACKALLDSGLLLFLGESMEYWMVTSKPENFVSSRYGLSIKLSKLGRQLALQTIYPEQAAQKPVAHQSAALAKQENSSDTLTERLQQQRASLEEQKTTQIRELETMVEELTKQRALVPHCQKTLAEKETALKALETSALIPDEIKLESGRVNRYRERVKQEETRLQELERNEPLARARTAQTIDGLETAIHDIDCSLRELEIIQEKEKRLTLGRELGKEKPLDETTQENLRAIALRSKTVDTALEAETPEILLSVLERIRSQAQQKQTQVVSNQ